ncbi:hypothetical protein CFM96_17490 [Klebsiella michiganensis]|nr:hypothetical protein [Klebsiella michiganensis]
MWYHGWRTEVERREQVVPDEVEHVAAVLELIGGFEAADIDSDTVDLRFEIDDVDTGSDVSITEYAARGSAIIRMLAGNSPVIPDTWIPVSERMPENKPGCYKYLVFETLNNRVNNDYWNVPDKGDEAFTPFWNYYGEHVTHWMPLPAAPQELK